MTIRQQGGVFGRNPKFNDVEAENLTVTDATMGQAQVDNININGNTISSTDANGNITFDPNGTGRVVAASQFQALGGAYIETPNTGVSQFLQFDRNQATIGDIGQIQFYTNDGAGNPTEYGRITGAATRINNGIELGEVYISTTLNGVLREAGRFTSAGNLAFPNGQGIDFSATSGTGTSELFDDYEEGTWTPAVTGGWTGVTYVNQLGSYTKIGNLVTAWFYLNFSGTSAAANVTISGLPFTAANVLPNRSGTITYVDVPMGVGLKNIAPYTGQNATTFQFYEIPGSSGLVQSTGNAANDYLVGCVTYAV